MNTGPFTLTVRTPSVWPHCLGKNHKNIDFGAFHRKFQVSTSASDSLDTSREGVEGPAIGGPVLVNALWHPNATEDQGAVLAQLIQQIIHVALSEKYCRVFMFFPSISLCFRSFTLDIVIYPPNIAAYVSVSDIAGRTRHTKLPESRRGMAMDWLRRAHLLGKSNECETRILRNGGENISAHVIPSGFRIPKYHSFESGWM